MIILSTDQMVAMVVVVLIGNLFNVLIIICGIRHVIADRIEVNKFPLANTVSTIICRAGWHRWHYGGIGASSRICSWCGKEQHQEVKYYPTSILINTRWLDGPRQELPEDLSFALYGLIHQKEQTIHSIKVLLSKRRSSYRV